MRFFRFSMLALLILATLASVGAGWVAQYREIKVEAALHVPVSRDVLIGCSLDQQGIDKERALRSSYQAVLQGRSVLEIAIAMPEVHHTFLAGEENPLRWLSSHLETYWESSDKPLVVRLRGRKKDTQELLTVLRAVCEAFMSDLRLADGGVIEQQIQELEEMLDEAQTASAGVLPVRDSGESRAAPREQGEAEKNDARAKVIAARIKHFRYEIDVCRDSRIVTQPHVASW